MKVMIFIAVAVSMAIRVYQRTRRILKPMQVLRYKQQKFLSRLLGRPSQTDWPAEVAIPISSFPVQSSKPVSQFVSRMDDQAADLLLVSTLATPSGLFQRINLNFLKIILLLSSYLLYTDLTFLCNNYENTVFTVCLVS